MLPTRRQAIFLCKMAASGSDHVMQFPTQTLKAADQQYRCFENKMAAPELTDELPEKLVVQHATTEEKQWRNIVLWNIQVENEACTKYNSPLLWQFVKWPRKGHFEFLDKVLFLNVIFNNLLVFHLSFMCRFKVINALLIRLFHFIWLDQTQQSFKSYPHLAPTSSLFIHYMHAGGGGGGGSGVGWYSFWFWVGVCHWDSETLFLYQTMFS